MQWLDYEMVKFITIPISQSHLYHLVRTVIQEKGLRRGKAFG
ncbi:hypothetical protein DFP95_14012 [Cohnella lupini]|uniref:Uncharacterized protein n=1 Tax=Cohnella lupini TaxID=1294267 RepID=A0A3D9HQD3_9BACL|nr:hypothetical protein DFP95_14012 [Cohnella lupini]